MLKLFVALCVVGVVTGEVVRGFGRVGKVWKIPWREKRAVILNERCRESGRAGILGVVGTHVKYVGRRHRNGNCRLMIIGKP